MVIYCNTLTHPDINGLEITVKSTVNYVKDNSMKDTEDYMEHFGEEKHGISCLVPVDMNAVQVLCHFEKCFLSAET